MGRYRVVIGDLSGEPIEEVPPRALQFARALNDAGSLSFEILKKEAKARRSLLEPGERTILAMDGDVKRFQAALWGATGGSDNETVKFGGPGRFADLGERFIDARREYADVEQFDIAWDLIDWTQTKVPGADLGITRWDGETPSGITRSVVYVAGERPMIDDSLKTLASGDDGFDFEVTADGIWKVHHPAAGQDSAAAFIHPRKNILAFAYTIDASEITSHLTAIGGQLAIEAASWSSGDHKITFTAKAHGWGVGRKVTVGGMEPGEYNVSNAPITDVPGANSFKVAGPGTNPGAVTQLGTVVPGGGPTNILEDAEDADAIARYRLREHPFTFSDVHTHALLKGIAAAQLDARSSPTEQPQLTVTVDDPDSSLGAFDLGDTAKVKLDDGYFDVDDRFRVVGITVQVTPEGQVRAALAFDKRVGAKWIRGRQVQRQMADLLERVGRLERRS